MSFTGQPVLSTPVRIASLTIGTTTPATLTINASLTVDGSITQNNNSKAGGIITNLAGSGNITCTNFVLGDATVPPVPTGGAGLTNAAYLATLNFSSLNLTITNNLLLRTTSNSAFLSLTTYSSNVNNPVFNFKSGTISVGNQLKTSDLIDANTGGFTFAGLTFTPVSSSAQFLMNPAAGNTSTLILNGSIPLALDVNAGYADFYGTAGGTSVVNYGGTVNQEVYTTSAPFSSTSRLSGALTGLDRTPVMYQNIVFSGTAIKTADAGTLAAAGNLTISPSSTETVDFATNSPIVTVGGNFVSNTGATLSQGGTGTMSITGTSNNAGTINQTGSGNITFTGALNNSASAALIAQTGTGGIIASSIANAGTISQGSGTIGSITISAGLTNTGTVTQTTGGISVGTNLSNSGTLTLGSANLTVTGNYTNSGTYTQGTGTTLFNGASAEILQGGSGTGTVFKKVSFSGAGSKTLTSGNFAVSSSGVLTMIGTSSLAANGFLTLNSDASGSAIVAALPTGASITGNVNVQRFIKGSNSGTVHNLSKRGYRLLSATVFTGTDALGSHVSDLQYLTNYTYVSGAGSGFNVTTTRNPSIYLFREDDPPPPNNSAIFTTGYNWKGVAQINNTPLYNIGIQAKNTTTNINDTTVTIPVGNGMLYFFRGNNVSGGNSSTTGTQLSIPFNFPDDVTLKQTGTLNTGTIAVRLWYAAPALGNKFSYTPTYVNSGTATLRGGFTCVGNPYPSTINWEKFNNTNAPGAITGGGGLPSKIWVFNVASKQYETYMPALGTDITSERPTGSMITGTSASNFIASGQGFFVQASATGQTLTFTEAAKISKQPTAANLNNLMGKPKEFTAQPKAFIRLKMIKDTVNTDDILIALSKKADMKYEDNEDAQDLGGSNALVSLSSFSADSVKLAINSSPFPGLQQQVIPISADATASGTYTLTSPQLDNLPALYDIWLKDAFTNDSLKLKLNAAYQFTIDKNNPASFGNGRFTLLIRQNPANAYQLLDFTANKLNTGRQVQLVWKTSNEENYTNFTVQRSTDGGNTFDAIGGLQGTGAGNYSLLDNRPVNGQNFYRLKQTDLNNTISYTKPVLIMYNGTGSGNGVNAYPNPAVSTIHVAIANETGAPHSYNIRITNSSGMLIRQVTAAQADWQSSIAGLKPGTYIIRVRNSADNSFIGDTKFVKL